MVYTSFYPILSLCNYLHKYNFFFKYNSTLHATNTNSYILQRTPTKNTIINISNIRYMQYLLNIVVNYKI